jgi:hypothetical protein
MIQYYAGPSKCRYQTARHDRPRSNHRPQRLITYQSLRRRHDDTRQEEGRWARPDWASRSRTPQDVSRPHAAPNNGTWGPFIPRRLPPVSTAVIAPTRVPRAVPRTWRRNPSIMLRDFPKRGDAQSASSAEQSTTTVRAVLHSSLSSDLPLATHRSSHCNAGPLAPVPTCQRNHRKPQAGGSSIHTHGRGRRSRNRAARRGTVAQSRQRSGVGRRCRWLGSPSLPLNAAPPFTSVRLTPPSLFSLPSCGCRPHESRAPAAKSAPRSAPLDARSLTPASAPS